MAADIYIQGVQKSMKTRTKVLIQDSNQAYGHEGYF